jgi:hypothetical protein
MHIETRPGKIGSSINTRSEKHGDEDVPACDIPLAGIMLEAEELNALLGDPSAHKSLFEKPKNGAPVEPRFQRLKAFVLRDKFEGQATLSLGLNATEVDLGDVTFARITLEPQCGGMTEMSLQVQCAPPVETMAQVIAFLNDHVDVELNFGELIEQAKRKQKDLGLSFGDGDSGDSEQPPALN